MSNYLFRWIISARHFLVFFTFHIITHPLNASPPSLSPAPLNSVNTHQENRLPPPLMQANIYAPSIELEAYWVSEKYDGVRAYWNGKQLISRQGNVYHAPAWFIKDFPTTPLDGAEGLMLHRGSSYYHAKRNDDLLKLKTFQDAEARVLTHLPGKGKFKGLMGALLVENEQGLRFKVGSGFNIQERQNPPPIGTSITYKYYGKTQNGLPRFASFMRIRNAP